MKFYRLLPRYEEKEIIPNTPSLTDTYNIKRDRGKSIREIAKETRDRQRKQKEVIHKENTNNGDNSENVDKSTKQQKEEDDTAKSQIKLDKVDDTANEEGKEKKKPVEKEEPKVDHEALAKKAAEEAARKVADETKLAFQEEVAKILNKDKDVLEKQKEADELVAVWDKENRLPTDWKEIASEQLRISDAKLEQRLKAEQANREAKATEERLATEKQQKEAKTQEETKRTEFQNKIAEDLEEIYTAKLLPKPTNLEEINNPETSDPAAKLTQEVLNFGVKLNTERVKQNLLPVTSLNKIFFLHYQPYKAANPDTKTKQPAGADAPVGGAKNTIVERSKTAYVYARDHNKTFAQIGAEIAARTRKAS